MRLTDEGTDGLAIAKTVLHSWLQRGNKPETKTDLSTKKICKGVLEGVRDVTAVSRPTTFKLFESDLEIGIKCSEVCYFFTRIIQTRSLKVVTKHQYTRCCYF